MNDKSKRTISEKSENDFRELRELFIRRMTVDSSCTDRIEAAGIKEAKNDR